MTTNEAIRTTRELLNVDETEVVGPFFYAESRENYYPGTMCSADDCLQLSEAFRVIGESLKTENKEK